MQLIEKTETELVSAVLIALGVNEEWALDNDPEWLEDCGLAGAPLWEQVKAALDIYEQHELGYELG